MGWDGDNSMGLSNLFAQLDMIELGMHFYH